MRLTEENRSVFSVFNRFLVREGFTAIAENLGVDVNQTNTYGETPLHVAAKFGKFDVAQLLLDRGADVNKARNYGVTPLYIAAERGQLAVAQLLLDRGADVNKAVMHGRTPLYIAAYNGQLAVAQLLLDRGADVNQAETTYGVTPLHIAALEGQLDVAQLLLFATKLSARPDVRFTLPPTMSADPIIRQILDCDQDLFRGLRDNLNLIAQADKAGLSPAEYNSLSLMMRSLLRFNSFQAPSTRNTTTNPINTSQIVLKALYEHFGRGGNLPQLLETFTARTTPAQLNRFNLNDSQSLLTLLPKLSEKRIPTEISTNIAQYAGAFCNKRLKALLEAHFNGKEVKDLTTVAAEARLLEEVDTQPDYLAELITRLNVLLKSNLPDNITKNDDGTYTYQYDAGNGAAESAEKPLNQLTESELTVLNHQIEARLARQQAAQEAGGQAEARTAASPKDLSHVARLAEQRAQEQVTGAQPNGR